MADHTVKVVEVDPKVYIMCRLCLEEMGRYQIVPTVQSKIKYCFDITVDHFDGLPQLLCQNCTIILDQYVIIKTKFAEKQNKLISTLKCNKENAQNLTADISSQTPENKTKDDMDVSVQQVDRISLKSDDRKKNRLVSASSTESLVCTKSKKIRKHLTKKGWKKKYVSYFVCNLCSNRYEKRKRLLLHLYNVHSNVKTKYHLILNKVWQVKLNKIDNNINETGNTNNTVMFNLDKIVQNTGNALYHVLYVSRKQIYGSNKSSRRESSLKRSLSDSSEEELFVTKKRRQIRRPISTSSNETVLIDEEANKNAEVDSYEIVRDEPIVQESVIEVVNVDRDKKLVETTPIDWVINIDDSSDSDMDLNSVKSSAHTNKIECKTIENIISVCKTKYTRKMESNKSTAKSQSFLKHKLLSIGRKIIKKEGNLNCIGILRSLEHQDLDILWIPQIKSNTYGESLVRIMTNLKYNYDNDTLCDNTGWVSFPDSDCNEFQNNQVPFKDLKKQLTSKVPTIPHVVAAEQTGILQGPQTLETVNSTMLSTDNSIASNNSLCLDLEINSKILLNKTPVANPKQLPKKAIALGHITDAKPVEDIFKPSIFVHLVEEQSSQPNSFMPIITSTTSLADLPDTIKDDTLSTTSNVSTTSDVIKDADRNVPRIKVKPASELMKPENILKAKDSNNIWSTVPADTQLLQNGNAENAFVPTMMLPQIQNVHSMQPLVQYSEIVPAETKAPEHVNNNITDPVILDTPEFPNTKTTMPFLYFKYLLALHNISLLTDPNNITILHDYTCLLKIKVHFKQENKSKVVVLCLSIFCANQNFCICIKDTNQTDIQMTKVSANWQWEILKIFQGEVSNKILQNAEKAGQECYAQTKTFMRLLKSITCKLPLAEEKKT